MKPFRTEYIKGLSLISSLFLLAAAGMCLFGCAEIVQVAGEISATQAQEKTFQEEYNKALRQGMSQDKAKEVATQAAQKKAAQKRELAAGIGDVMSSTGEIKYETELVIGESLALEGFGRYGLPVKDAELQNYVNRLGNSVARNSVRPGIPYRFVVVENDLYNAFACPGGIIFLSSRLMSSLHDEAELAGVLAHEIAHVSHRHALNSIRRAKFFEGAGKITASVTGGKEGQDFQKAVRDLQSVLFDKGLDKSMEYEADLSGMETAYRTGYDPRGLIRVGEILRANEASAKKENSWFSTHPPLESRLERMRNQLANYPDAESLARVADRFQSYQKRLGKGA